MVEVISWIVGLVLGTALFLLIRSLIPAIHNSVAATVFVFILCYGVGISICQVAWIIGVIGGIIAFIIPNIIARVLYASKGLCLLKQS